MPPLGFVYVIDYSASDQGGDQPSVARHPIERCTPRYVFVSCLGEYLDADGAASGHHTTGFGPDGSFRLDRVRLEQAGELRHVDRYGTRRTWTTQAAYDVRRPELARQYRQHDETKQRVEREQEKAARQQRDHDAGAHANRSVDGCTSCYFLTHPHFTHKRAQV